MMSNAKQLTRRASVGTAQYDTHHSPFTTVESSSMCIYGASFVVNTPTRAGSSSHNKVSTPFPKAAKPSIGAARTLIGHAVTHGNDVRQLDMIWRTIRERVTVHAGGG